LRFEVSCASALAAHIRESNGIFATLQSFSENNLSENILSRIFSTRISNKDLISKHPDAAGIILRVYDVLKITLPFQPGVHHKKWEKVRTTNNLATSGQTANNLPGACGTEMATCIYNVQKKKTKTPHATAATAA
jgi:hypothetical protein